MIARLGALIAIFYVLGFVLFAVTLGQPADASLRKADGAIVLTGGKGRIEHAVAVLRRGDVQRLLIAGADPAVTKRDLIARLGGANRAVNCCVDLEQVSVDTRSNAEEARDWVQRHRYRSVLLITSDWHMRRSAYEFRRVLGTRVIVRTDAVRTQPPFVILFGEYNKYLFRRLAVLTGIT